MPKINEYYVEDKFRNTSLFDRKKHFQLTAEKYWHDINDCWELIENCEEHLEILEECRRFTDWKIYSLSEVAPKRLAKFGDKGFPGRWIAFPTHETFPTFMNWYERKKNRYHDPEIRKLDAGAIILPHTHDREIESKYLYNMSIKHPEGCLFGIKPGGRVPYKAGDVMKINVWNEHCVWNNSKEDRYHAILGVIKNA